MVQLYAALEETDHCPHQRVGLAVDLGRGLKHARPGIKERFELCKLDHFDPSTALDQRRT